MNYQTDATECTIGHHSKATSETTCFLAGAEGSKGPPASASPAASLVTIDYGPTDHPRALEL